jgi:hypothetical protein
VGVLGPALGCPASFGDEEVECRRCGERPDECGGGVNVPAGGQPAFCGNTGDDGAHGVEAALHAVGEDGGHRGVLVAGALGDPGQGVVPTGADVVDLGEATVLPGLIDAHVHLTLDASGDPVGRLAGASDDTVLHRMRASARTS